jgi:hypothetical protein
VRFLSTPERSMTSFRMCTPTACLLGFPVSTSRSTNPWRRGLKRIAMSIRRSSPYVAGRCPQRPRVVQQSRRVEPRGESSCGALHRAGVAPAERSVRHAPRGRLFQSRCRTVSFPKDAGLGQPSGSQFRVLWKRLCPAGPRALLAPGCEVDAPRGPGGWFGSIGQAAFSSASPVAEAPPMPAIDESLDRLQRAGWSVGHAAFSSTWQVDGTNGENVLFACAKTLEEAYRLACVQARALGMRAPAREDWRRGRHRSQFWGSRSSSAQHRRGRRCRRRSSLVLAEVEGENEAGRRCGRVALGGGGVHRASSCGARG